MLIEKSLCSAQEKRTEGTGLFGARRGSHSSSARLSVLLLLLGHLGRVGLPLLVVVLDEALGVGGLGLLSGLHALSGDGLSQGSRM